MELGPGWRKDHRMNCSSQPPGALRTPGYQESIRCTVQPWPSGALLISAARNGIVPPSTPGRQQATRPRRLSTGAVPTPATSNSPGGRKGSALGGRGAHAVCGSAGRCTRVRRRPGSRGSPGHDVRGWGAVRNSSPMARVFPGLIAAPRLFPANPWVAIVSPEAHHDSTRPAA